MVKKLLTLVVMKHKKSKPVLPDCFYSHGKNQLIIHWVLSAFWILCTVIYELFLRSQGPGIKSVWFIPSLLFGISFAVLAWLHWQHSADKMVKTLLENPNKWVWIYPLNIRMEPFGIYLFRRNLLVFADEQGQKHYFHLLYRDRNSAYNWVKQTFTTCTFGFDDENAWLYKIDPNLLKK